MKRINGRLNFRDHTRFLTDFYIGDGETIFLSLTDDEALFPLSLNCFDLRIIQVIFGIFLKLKLGDWAV